MLLGWLFNETLNNVFHPSVSLKDLSLWLDLLIIKTVSQESPLLTKSLEIFFSNHKNTVKITIVPDVKKFNPRSIGYMGEVVDYISMYQVVSNSKKLRFFAK